MLFDSLTALWPIEQHPDSQIVREVFEAMHNARRDEK
jgi:hypothetical protein